MVIREYFKTRSDGIKLYKHYSDNNKMIIQLQTGVEYDEAIDVENAPFTYVESTNDIVKEEEVFGK